MPTKSNAIELWGGLEGTVNRVADQYFSQLDQNGHDQRLDDLDRFAALGIRALRYPVLWERTAPGGIGSADWSWADERLPALRDIGITPIVGLVHHGSGPPHTSLVDDGFAPGLAEYAGAFAQRFPWVEYYTPVNEPCTTARFCGLYGLWYPHARDDLTFLRALMNQCKGVVLSMRAIRAVNPNAKLVQTDDLGKTYSTPELEEWADFYNERRWLAWDLLCGRVTREHELWQYFMRSGVRPDEVLWFHENPCPPDIIGLNYYVTSERLLDHRGDRYPARYVGPDGFADIEAARALATPTPGIAPLLQEVWERYGLPMAVTEAHIDANREDQMRWLNEIWCAAEELQRRDVDIRAVTVWSLLGSFDWNCLVTECKGYYETGAFDLRGPAPRPTALARMMQQLATGRPPTHPVLQGPGWWRRPGRFLCPPVATSSSIAALPNERCTPHGPAQPILVIGATGTLGAAFARICSQRSLACHVLTRQEMDMTDPAAVEAAIARCRPWAIVNAGGYVRVHDAEGDMQRCLRENAQGPAVLAVACARHDIQLLTFSSDLVFDGKKESPYIETDPVAPLNIYGRSKAEAERRVLTVNPQALVVRTSAFFGPWDQHNFVTQALSSLRRGNSFEASAAQVVTPTYVPDLVNNCLDLLIDREAGIWHLSNGEALSWAQLARRACELAGVPCERLIEVPAMSGPAAHPRYSALGTSRGQVMPTLDEALARYLEAVAPIVESAGYNEGWAYGAMQ